MTAMTAAPRPPRPEATSATTRAFAAWAVERPGSGPLLAHAGTRVGAPTAPMVARVMAATPMQAASRGADERADEGHAKGYRTSGSPYATGLSVVPLSDSVIANEGGGRVRSGQRDQRDAERLQTAMGAADARALALELAALRDAPRVDVVGLGLVLEAGEPKPSSCASVVHVA